MAEQFRQIKRSVAELFRQIKRSVAELFRQIKRSVAEHLEKKHVKGGGLLYGGFYRDPPFILFCQYGHNLRLRSEPLEAEA